MSTHSDVLYNEVIENKRVAGGAGTKTNTKTAQVNSKTQFFGPCTLDVGEGNKL